MMWGEKRRELFSLWPVHKIACHAMTPSSAFASRAMGTLRRHSQRGEED